MTPLASLALVVAAFLTWKLPRRLAICPLLAMTCLVTLGQQIVVAGFHLYLFRVLLLVGIARVVIKGEAVRLKMTMVDRLFVAWALVMLFWGVWAEPTTSYLQYKTGACFDALGCYLFIRCVIVDLDDAVVAVRTLAFLSMPVAILMIIEHFTSHNLLSVFGGVSATTIVRGDRLRSQGAFRHPILAGTFGATQAAIFVGLWFYNRKYRMLAVISIVSAVGIVVTSASGGPLLSLLVAIGGWALWKWRNHMRSVRWAAALTFIGLTMVMNAPPWYILTKLGNLTGGTGWHRAWLISQFISHFDQWCLFGTSYTANWAPDGLVLAVDPANMDITNQYVAEGIHGGILELILFMAIIVQCFKNVGRRVHAEVEHSLGVAMFVWALGVSLFVHCISLISITYFDQSVNLWYFLLAVIAAVPSWQIRKVESQASQMTDAGDGARIASAV